MSIKVLTFNIHKGFNWNNSKVTIKHLKENLERLHPDIVLLQEVVGENLHHEKKFDNWISNQFDFLAKDLWSESVYSKHALFDHRHHGNVILSKFPVIFSETEDISLNKFEQRSILYSQLEYENNLIHVLCVHLNLLGRDRKKQYQLIKKYIKSKSIGTDPIILAGDFNDWNQQASKNLLSINDLHDAHKSIHGSYGKTFPAIMPMIKLDRIYTKGFKINSSEVLSGIEWNSLSDHLPIHIEIELL